MNDTENQIERRLRISGLLIILGLLTETVCLFWAHPLSFLLFISIGGAFLFLGAVLYLLSIASTKHSSTPSSNIRA